MSVPVSSAPARANCAIEFAAAGLYDPLAPMRGLRPFLWVKRLRSLSVCGHYGRCIGSALGLELELELNLLVGKGYQYRGHDPSVAKSKIKAPIVCDSSA
ncbi:hypothetical protein PG990_014584 [Apiospora arundinis]